MSRSDAPVELDCSVAGKRRYTIWRCVFELDEDYVPLRGIGKGAYGVVCSAKDRRSDTKVAIKKIASAFNNKTEAIRCLREVNLLRHVSHANIITIRGIMKPATYLRFEDVYVVYEFMDTDLHQIIRSKQPLSDEHFKYFIMQTLRGLKYLHSANIIHRDLKPSNLLVNATCDLRIADFGLARSRDCRDDMTQYVVTRWYRAPELLLMSPYNKSIDIWSVGCILGELLLRSPLFEVRSASGHMQILKKIIEVVGKPTNEDLQHIDNPAMKAYIQTFPKAVNSLAKQFPNANPLAVDFMTSALQFNPAKRPTAEEALDHPWFDDIRNEEWEVTASRAFEHEFDEDSLETDGIRELMIREIEYWNGNNTTTATMDDPL